MTFFWPKPSGFCAQTQPDHERSVYAKVAETFNIHWVVTPVQLKANMMKQQDEATWEYKQVESEITQRDSVKSYKVLRAEHTETFKHHSFFSPAQPWVEYQSFFGGGGEWGSPSVGRSRKTWFGSSKVVMEMRISLAWFDSAQSKPPLEKAPSPCSSLFFPVFTSFTVRVSLMHF